MKKKTYIQLFLAAFICLGAIYGSYMMISDPSGKSMGMQQLLPYMQKLPFSEIFFQNFLIPGITLGIVNGMTNLISIILILKKHPWGALSGILCGIILMVWTGIQFIILPFNAMSASFFLLGLIQVINGIRMKPNKSTNQ